MKRSVTILIASVILIQCSDEKELPSPVPVIADFTASNTVIKAGESVTFADASQGDPASWTWTFNGGDPTTSNDQNPTIKYQSPGSYQVSLKASNGSSEDTETKENCIVVEAPGGLFELNNSEATYGPSAGWDVMQSMVVLEDNSFISVGWTDHGDALRLNENILIAKFDQNMRLVLENVIGGSGADLVREVIQTEDGGFLISATTESNDGDIPENLGMADIMISKLSASGDIQWVRTYGGSDYDGVNKNSLIEIDDGYAFIGFTKSDDAAIPDKVGSTDIWLVELDNSGNVVSSVALGSTEADYPYSFVKSGTGYVILSKIGAATTDFNVPGIWIFEVTPQADLLWKTFIDGLNAGKLIKTQDGGYATINANKDNLSDLFVSKLDNMGVVQWTNAYPLPDQEFPQDILQVENNYILMGSSERSGNPVKEGSVYVAKINTSGELLQSIRFGSDKINSCRIFRMDDSTYLLGGTKDVGQSYIDFDFWLQFLSDSN